MHVDASADASGTALHRTPALGPRSVAEPCAIRRARGRVRYIDLAGALTPTYPRSRGSVHGRASRREPTWRTVHNASADASAALLLPALALPRERQPHFNTAEHRADSLHASADASLRTHRARDTRPHHDDANLRATTAPTSDARYRALSATDPRRASGAPSGTLPIQHRWFFRQPLPTVRSPLRGDDHFRILVTRPAPTVRPPSRTANLRPSSMAIGAISSTVTAVLSPGIQI